MPEILEDYLARLPAEERQRIDARAEALLGERAALMALHAALARSRDAVQPLLQAGPQSLLRMERRIDAYIGALREALHLLGGELDITVRLPEGPPVRLSQFEGLLGGA
ncbi:MAG: hypothetical protein IRY94_02115 [Rhodospirillaceae bacterium]|nr:hypothetical protein [Rhodospirillaceae bacterium]